MEWTTDEPTQEGYYWAWTKHYDFPATRDEVHFAHLVRVTTLTHRGKTRLFAVEDSVRNEMYFYSHWMGPLQPPGPPK